MIAGGPPASPGGGAPSQRDLVAAALLALPGARVVAADSGLATALAAGCVPDVVVGDLDSADPADVEVARAAGSVIERHPVDKDHTDLELALDVAVGGAADRIIVVGGLGGRVDHALAGALLLASPRFASVAELEARIGAARVVVLHGPAQVGLAGGPGAIVTLVPVLGAATGVSTDGLRFPLDRETLPPGTTRGVSNVVESAPAAVRVGGGTLFVVEPEHHRPQRAPA